MHDVIPKRGHIFKGLKFYLEHYLLSVDDKVTFDFSMVRKSSENTEGKYAFIGYKPFPTITYIKILFLISNCK